MTDLPEGVTIETHRTPPDYWTGEGKNIGHLRAVGNGVSVSLPCSLAMLDDQDVVDHYVRNRLLLFYRMEKEHMSDEDKRQLMQERP